MSGIMTNDLPFNGYRTISHRLEVTRARYDDSMFNTVSYLMSNHLERQVTVFGESAGAISIGAHLLPEYHTPRKLFRAAIMQSGASARSVIAPENALLAVLILMHLLPNIVHGQ